MIPVTFDYTAPTSVADAVAALAEGGEDAKVLAGGQSLLPVLRLRMAAPSLLVDLGKIDELRGVRLDGESVVIGSMTTHYTVITDAVVAEHLALLAKATETVADPQVRHRGTLGGALSHADPAGDQAAVAVALDATMEIAGPSGSRSVAATDFFTDYFTTALGPGEILTAIRFPSYAGWGAHFEKFQRVAQAWSIVAAAATVRVSGGSVTAARVALTNVGPTPVRATGVEAALVGGPATAEAFRAAAASAAEGTSPVSDTAAPAEYREHLARVLTARAVLAAAG
jgi:carbon-monoxide dehydrogenase medium subunit